MAELRRAGDGRFYSYAQCGEDAVLLRLFADQPTGFWVDVGANHPIHDSVTKNFSDMGWTGINVEPVESLHAELMKQRPNDINVMAGLSDHEGEMIFHRVDSNFGLSTFDATLAEQHESSGHTVSKISVPITTLSQVCEQYLGGRTIDFLKIDTERHELEVLRGHDFSRFPVRVLLAETGDDYEPIVDHVVAQGMRLAQFDGLNCWFVSSDEPEHVVRLLGRPVHRVLDGYHPVVYTSQLDAQHARILELEQQNHQQAVENDRLRARVGESPMTPSDPITRRVARAIGRRLGAIARRLEA